MVHRFAIPTVVAVLSAAILAGCGRSEVTETQSAPFNGALRVAVAGSCSLYQVNHGGTVVYVASGGPHSACAVAVSRSANSLSAPLPGIGAADAPNPTPTESKS